jgi:hypothetical protein
MGYSEQMPGFVPRIMTATLLRLSLGLLAASLTGCPGVQISHDGDSAPTASATAAQSSSTPATPITPATPLAAQAPGTGSAALSWAAPTENEDGTPIEELAGYRIHVGPSAADLNQLIEVSGADSTTYVVAGLNSGTYYFAVSAYNAFGIEGPLSNVASKTF